MAYKIRKISIQAFRSLCIKYIPHVKKMTPRTDLCLTCEEFRDKIKSAKSVA